MKTPTFTEWLTKYFTNPYIKVLYRSKMPCDDKEYTLKQLKTRYKKAFKS